MSKKLLVVVDYQVDFVVGSLGFPKAVELEQGIYDKCVKYFENGDSIMFTYDTHDDNYLETREGKGLPVPHCVYGTEGHRLYGKLNDFIEDTFEEDDEIHHVMKKSFGYMPSHFVQRCCSDVSEIEIIGVATNICVISNAVTFQTVFPEAKIIVDASLCASFDDELHEKSLDVMEGLQVKIINRTKADKIIDTIDKAIECLND